MSRLQQCVRFGAIAAAIIFPALAGAQAGSATPQKGKSPLLNKAGHKKLAHLKWSSTDGKPKINPGKQVGYFIWHEGNTVSIVVTDKALKGQYFVGRVRLNNGVITNPIGLKGEDDKRVQVLDTSNIRFRFKTKHAEDGVTFNIAPGATQLYVNLDWLGHPTYHVYLGKSKTEPPSERHKGWLAFDIAR
ncbi:MAG: hypothetical protein KGJ62_07595 [Armatimonadetes bacterium]|nr:hypothetical protein [Armatimonadota bacterium]MDE2207220.1 hypothetical protein [Armatimonadota bacterium]